MLSTNSVGYVRLILLFGALALQFGSTNCFAGDLTYECKVLHVYDIENGALSNSDKKSLSSVILGTSFIVSKDTGAILGEYINTTNADLVKVLERGSDRWNFRSLAEWDNKKSAGTYVAQLLEVRESNVGTSKPFTLFSAGMLGVLSGTCK
ncbi:hypothetical protein ACO0LM_25115 [Undibacterium sp. Di26W]|uniref:hypothetical protein n=1 Tax=Undibacterium sp. Di26W TaxID=3413035 RepID=UPI003BF0CA10